MSWLEANIFGGLNKLKNEAWSMAFLVLVTMMSAVPRSTAQTMQKGISVELAPTRSAVPVPDADNQNALIITVTDSGELYFGIDPVVPDSLVEKLKERVSHRTLYIKADARASYAYVIKILDAAHIAGVAGVLTAQPKTTQLGTAVLPEGIEMELGRRSPAAVK